jgi:hypothetical protein
MPYFAIVTHFSDHSAIILMRLWLFVGLRDLHGDAIVLTLIIVSRIPVNIPQITFFSIFQDHRQVLYAFTIPRLASTLRLCNILCVLPTDGKK